MPPFALGGRGQCLMSVLPHAHVRAIHSGGGERGNDLSFMFSLNHQHVSAE